MTHLVVVAPLKPGTADRVRELLVQGPPFDLEETAFQRHTVHLTDREAIFIFDAGEQAAQLQLSGEDPEIWKVAAAWQEVFAERPRIALTLFSWERSEDAVGVSFEPTPGPGDSDGGDLYSP
jgi:hypothetical protein